MVKLSDLKQSELVELPVTLKPEEIDVAIEAEFALVDHQGHRYETSTEDFLAFCEKGAKLLIPWKPSKGVKFNNWNIILEGGGSTLEFVAPVYENLFQLMTGFNSVMKMVLEVGDIRGFRLLGGGTQPIDIWTEGLFGHQRYDILNKRYGFEKLSPFCDAASLQTHGKCSQETFCKSSILSLLAPVFVSLFGNNCIRGGKLVGIADRLGIWESLDPKRSGLVVCNDFEEFVDKVGGLDAIMRKVYVEKNGKQVENWIEVDGIFGDQQFETVKECCEAFFAHSTTIWTEMRSTRFGTGESRTPCQQLPGETHMPPAMYIGLMANLEAVDSFLRKILQEYGGVESGIIMFENWFKETVVKGPRAKFDGSIGLAQQIVRDVLKFAKEGLVLRGFGEEILIEELFTRVETIACPADRVQDIFIREGLQSAIDFMAFSTEKLVDFA